MQTVVRFPSKPVVDAPAAKLAEILRESAYLLEASRDSDDPEVRDGSIDLAIRSLRAASLALGPVEQRIAGDEGRGRIIQGPWAPKAQSSRS